MLLTLSPKDSSCAQEADCFPDLQINPFSVTQLWLFPYKIMIRLKAKANIWTKIIAHIRIKSKAEMFPEGLRSLRWLHCFSNARVWTLGCATGPFPLVPGAVPVTPLLVTVVFSCLFLPHRSAPRPWEGQAPAREVVDNIYEACRHPCRNTASRRVLRNILFCLPQVLTLFKLPIINLTNIYSSCIPTSNLCCWIVGFLGELQIQLATDY